MFNDVVSALKGLSNQSMPDLPTERKTNQTIYGSYFEDLEKYATQLKYNVLLSLV